MRAEQSGPSLYYILMSLKKSFVQRYSKAKIFGIFSLLIDSF